MSAAYENLLGGSTAKTIAVAIGELMLPFASQDTVATVRTKGRSVRPCDQAAHEALLAASAPHIGWAYEFY